MPNEPDNCPHTTCKWHDERMEEHCGAPDTYAMRRAGCQELGAEWTLEGLAKLGYLETASCDAGTLLITADGLEQLYACAHGARHQYNDTGLFMWLPNALDTCDGWSLQDIENEAQAIDEVSIERQHKQVRIVVRLNLVSCRCFDLGWSEYERPNAPPKPGNLETGEPFQIGGELWLDDPGFRFYKLLDNRGVLVALVQVDEGDEEQNRILQLLVHAPRTHKAAQEFLDAQAERQKMESR